MFHRTANTSSEEQSRTTAAAAAAAIMLSGQGCTDFPVAVVSVATGITLVEIDNT